MGAMYGDLDGHEGYAARQLRDGTLTGTWTTETRQFDAYVAACGCGWNGTSRHDATEDGYEAALDEWDVAHARPLLRHAVPAHVRESVSEACRSIRALVDERPDAALKVLGDLDRWRVDIGQRVQEVAPAALAQARLDRLGLDRPPGRRGLSR